MSADSTPTGSPQMTPSSSIYTPSDLSFSQASFLDASTPAMSEFDDVERSEGRNQDFGRENTEGNVRQEDLESITGTETDDEAEQEWQESLQQLNLLVSLVVLPFFGKWIGRRCAYWAWTKFMTWKHPAMQMVVTNKAAWNAAGVVGAISGPRALPAL
ncbi:hypothetical protein BZA77DRAFT_385725 [Pyronema omphalodes]|nr:hypothetical protein BZA77DRAFT_385725 [Pyronema omphalodes]